MGWWWRARGMTGGLAGLFLAVVAAGAEPDAAAEEGGDSARPAATVAGVERTTPPATVEETGPSPLPEDPTAFTRVIEVDDYAGESKRIEDLVESVPGVHVRRFGGPGQPAEISIRGSTGAQVVVLLDGVRINSAANGGADLSTIPAELVERIEVSRGGGSLQRGSGAIGGVVNIVTRRPSAKPETSLGGAAGSFETWQASLSQTGRLGEAELMVGYDYFKTSGDWKFEPVSGVVPEDDDEIERINNRSEQHSGLLKVARDLGERTRIELVDSLFHSSEGRPGLDLAAGGEKRGQRERAHLRRTRNVAQLRLDGVEWSRADLDWDVTLDHRFERSHFRDPDLTPALDSDDRTMSLGLRGGLGGAFTMGPAEQRLSLGGEARREDFDPEGERDRSRNSVGVFAQDELGLFERRLLIVPGLRFEATEDFDDEWIPRIGAVAIPWPWLRFKGNVERSYRVPSFDELYLEEGTLRGNPDLRPEDAVNFDLGVELSRTSWGPLSRLRLEVVGFWNDIDDTIVFQQVSPNVILATNITNVRNRGLELYGGAAWDGLSLAGSYTYLDSEIRRSGNPLPGRPEQEADLRVTLAPWEGAVKLVGSMLYTDEIPVNASGRTTLNDRTTFDLSLRLALEALSSWPERVGLRELAFSVVAVSLKNRAVRDSLGFPQPGRILTFRLDARR
jgi:outer membrane cobalamin receptor